MQKTTTRTIETNLSMKYRNERKAHKDTKDELRKANLQHKDDLEVISTLTQENLELNKRNKDLLNRFVNGGLLYTINNDMVSSISIIQPVSNYTYLHDKIGVLSLENALELIKTPLYKKIPFIYEEDRQLKIDKTKYNKFKIIGGNI